MRDDRIMARRRMSELWAVRHLLPEKSREIDPDSPPRNFDLDVERERFAARDQSE
jgi:hypothetical protein